MNIENKKQFATILLAVGLGLVASLFASSYVKNEIGKNTAALAKDYEKKVSAQRATLVQEMEKRDRELSKKIAALVKKQNQMQTSGSAGQGPKAVVVDNTVFAEMLPKGKRALTILIDSLSAVGGLVNPGDFIDIIAHLDVPGSQFSEDETKVTSVMMQNIQVLAVGPNFKPEGNALLYQQQQKLRQLNITLALEPEEAGLLTFAQKHGSLQLALRAPNETETKVIQVAAWETLSDYVLEKQGTELAVPSSKAGIQSVEQKEVKPFIEIFRAGKEL